MKIITYSSALLVLIVLISGFLLHQEPDTMTMGPMLSISLVLGLYVVGVSLVGEGKVADERDMLHRYLSNRHALLAGTIVLSIGIVYQIFSAMVDYWLLAGLIGINVVKIASLIYAYYKK